MKHIPHLYLPGPWDHPTLEASGDQIVHMQRVLRIGDGADVTYTDGAGLFGQGRWAGETVMRGNEESRDRPRSLTIAVAPPSNRDRVRYVVEKLAEMGVETLQWLATRYGAERLPSLQRQQSWAISALEQSRGSWLMELGRDFVEWHDLERPLAVCVPGGHADTEAPLKTVAVGPEGGFDPGEIPDDAARMSLGETILRVETAALVAAAKFR